MTPLNCAECNNPFVDGDHTYRLTEIANGCSVCEECFTEYVRDLLITGPQKLARMMGSEVDVYRPYE